jgi:hypothetical protein
MLKRIGRFNYWDFIDVNPILKDQVQRRRFDFREYAWMFDKDFSSKYQKEYESGYEEAIFEFAEVNPFFLQYKWVRDQLQRWVHWNNERTRKLIKRLLFGSQRGKRNETNPKQLREITDRDKKVFIKLLNLRNAGYKLTGSSLTKGGKETKKRSAFGFLSENYDMSEENVRAVYRHYNKFYKRQEAMVKSGSDGALRGMINFYYGRFPFAMLSYTPAYIRRQSLQKQTRKVKSTKSELYQECRVLMEELRNPARHEENREHSFALSLLTNHFGEHWQGRVAEYYPWGFTQEGFVSFLRECKIPVRHKRYFMPYHFAIQSLFETIYRTHESPSPGEFAGQLDDFKIEDWL